MAWQHANFEEQSTASARLSKLQQHITEVRLEIRADVSHGGSSRSSATLQTYLAELERRRKEINAEVQAEIGRGPRMIRMRRR